MTRAHVLSLVSAVIGLGIGIAAVAAVPQVKGQLEWRKTMHHTPAPRVGCFHASYPSTEWQAVQCAPPPGYRSARLPNLSPEQVGGATGTSNDIVAQSPSGYFFSNVEGAFLAVTGVTSETGVGVPLYGNEGILGANEYTLQVNTNISHSAACGSYSYCKAWQQYVMSTNTPEIGRAHV